MFVLQNKLQEIPPTPGYSPCDFHFPSFGSTKIVPCPRKTAQPKNGKIRELWRSRGRGFADRDRVLPETVGNGLCIFPEDARLQFAAHFAQAGKIAGLDALPNLAVVHHVGFEKENRASIEAVGEKVPCPNMSAVT